MLAASVSDVRVRGVRTRVEELTAEGALVEGCDPIELVQQIMELGGDDRLGVMLLSEIRIRALRDAKFGEAYLAQESEMVASIAQIIDDIVSVSALKLRLPAETAARNAHDPLGRA